MVWGSRPPPFLHFNHEVITMNIKTFIAAAVTALTLAACAAENEEVLVPVDENAAAELNDDGSVKEAPAQ